MPEETETAVSTTRWVLIVRWWWSRSCCSSPGRGASPPFDDRDPGPEDAAIALVVTADRGPMEVTFDVERHGDDRGGTARRGEVEVLAPVGLHDPVRADRHHGCRHLDHPGRAVRPRRRRVTDPRHVRRGRLESAADPRRLARRSDQRPVRHRGSGDGQHRRLQQRPSVRGHRRRAVHPRDRRVHRHHDEDRSHPGRDRAARRDASAARSAG